MVNYLQIIKYDSNHFMGCHQSTFGRPNLRCVLTTPWLLGQPNNLQHQSTQKQLLTTKVYQISTLTDKFPQALTTNMISFIVNTLAEAAQYQRGDLLNIAEAIFEEGTQLLFFQKQQTSKNRHSFITPSFIITTSMYFLPNVLLTYIPFVSFASKIYELPF